MKVFEIGNSLREERLRRGLALEDVAKATHVREHYLAAIELDLFDELPTGAYRRIFVRDYAEFLGLDGDAYAREYELRFMTPDPEPFVPPPLVSRSRRAPAVAGVIVVAVLVGVFAWLLTRGGGPTATPPPATTTPPPAARPRTHTTHVLSEAKTTQSATMVVTATRGTCWLFVRKGSASGPTVYEQTLQQGQTVRFGLRTRLYIRVGAPWNIDATIAGRSVTRLLPAKTGDVVATRTGLEQTS